MTRRYDILRGDATSSSGTVLGGDASDTLGGREQAYEGDPVWCPQCKTVGRIACQGPRQSMRNASGREAALSDDICACGCSPSPLLIASQFDSYTDVWQTSDRTSS
ncbi:MULTISPECIES: PAAR domain-containing protein [Burkholderiaceae]|uniref:PAAR domain-containing protein n=1 Tax=Burkholderiaceae TaxID=119060 RepID=UPI000B8A0707|nr:PAAR domain-containing protein [Ralstonia sp. 25mfcol4.1]